MSDENKSTFAVVSELFNEMNTIKKKINAHLKKHRTKNCRIRHRIEKLKESLTKVKEEAAREDPILESLFENAIKEPDIAMETNDGNDATTSSTIRDLDVVGTIDNNDLTSSSALQKAHVIETNDINDPTTSSAVVEPADEIKMNDRNNPATSNQSSNNDNSTISAINNNAISSKYVEKSIDVGGCFRSYLAEELKNFPPEDFESLKKDIINVLNSHNPMEKV